MVDRRLEETPHLRWFEQFPGCRMCGKTAHGLLRGDRNESYGYHCKRCAERRLKLSKKVRQILADERAE